MATRLSRGSSRGDARNESRSCELVRASESRERVQTCFGFASRAPHCRRFLFLSCPWRLGECYLRIPLRNSVSQRRDDTIVRERRANVARVQCECNEPRNYLSSRDRAAEPVKLIPVHCRRNVQILAQIDRAIPVYNAQLSCLLLSPHVIVSDKRLR